MKIEVFGTPTCPNCKKVTTMLEQNNVKYTYLSVPADISKEDLEDKLNRRVSSVPVIFVDDEIEYSHSELASVIENMKND